MSVRPATAADLSAMLAIYAPYVKNTAYSFEYEVPTPEAFVHRFDVCTAQFPWLVWEEDGAILGYAYAAAPFERAAYQWCAEPSIYLSPETHGRGIGRRLYQALEEILRLQGYHVLYAVITTENAPSIAFHRALGYTQAALFPDCGFKFGRWVGTVWMEKRLASVETPSNIPVSWRQIVKNDRIFL